MFPTMVSLQTLLRRAKPDRDCGQHLCGGFHSTTDCRKLATRTAKESTTKTQRPASRCTGMRQRQCNSQILPAPCIATKKRPTPFQRQDCMAFMRARDMFYIRGIAVGRASDCRLLQQSDGPWVSSVPSTLRIASLQ